MVFIHCVPDLGTCTWPLNIKSGLFSNSCEWIKQNLKPLKTKIHMKHQPYGHDERAIRFRPFYSSRLFLCVIEMYTSNGHVCWSHDRNEFYFKKGGHCAINHTIELITIVKVHLKFVYFSLLFTRLVPWQIGQRCNKSSERKRIITAIGHWSNKDLYKTWYN